MKLYLLRFFILFTYYLLGAFATTDIPRLMKGSTVPVNARDCYCPVCGYRIPLSSQLPVISYLRNKGRCRNCHAPISLYDILPELIIWLVCSLLTVLFSFSFTGYWLSLLFYVLIKTTLLVRSGIRKTQRISSLLASFFNNLLFFGLLAILFGLHRLVIMI